MIEVLVLVLHFATTLLKPHPPTQDRNLFIFHLFLPFGPEDAAKAAKNTRLRTNMSAPCLCTTWLSFMPFVWVPCLCKWHQLWSPHSIKINCYNWALKSPGLMCFWVPLCHWLNHLLNYSPFILKCRCVAQEVETVTAQRASCYPAIWNHTVWWGVLIGRPSCRLWFSWNGAISHGFPKGTKCFRLCCEFFLFFYCTRW